MRSPETHARLTELFGEAIELPPAERAALLERVHAEDPELAAELVALLAADRLDAPALETGRLAAAPTVPSSDVTTQLDAQRIIATPLAPAIPNYSLLGVLGKGGMGVVYEARQGAPKRLVAIKVLHATSQESLARFRTEVEIMARLDHPGIAKIYEAGEAAGHPYYVMERVEGMTLEAQLGKLSRRARLETFAAICDAVHHAHVKGVFHRDLKPSNVMIRTDGRVAVLDFGIARLAGENATRAGELMGTPVYMSPEQARLRADEVDARSDVYTLGVILYEMLCGQLPYEVRGKPIAAIARTICYEPPRPLAEHDRTLRGDLTAICDRALQKEPERRYPSAAALADDVRRHLEGARVSVRVPGSIEQLRRFVRRRPGIAAAIVASVAGAIVVTVLWLEASAARQTADAERARLAAAHAVLEERTNQLVLDQARAALATDPTRSLALLRTLTARGVDARAAWAIVDEALGRGVATEVQREHAGEVRWVEPAPGGYVTGGYDGAALRWIGGTPQVLAREPRRVHLVRPSPDGTRYAIGFDGGLARIVDEAARTIAEVPALAGDVERIAWAADGRVAFADDRGTIVVWSRSGHAVAATGASGIESLGWFGHVLVAGYDDGTVLRVEPDANRTARAQLGSEVLAVWAGDDRVSAIGQDGKLRRWRGPALALVDELALGVTGKTAAFSADGAHAMIGGVDGRVVHVTGDTVAELRGHPRQVRSVIASPDGARFATAGDDGSVRVWDFARSRVLDLRGHTQRVRQLAFAAGATELLSGDSEGVVRRWELERVPPTVFEPAAAIARIATDGRTLVTVDADGELRSWNLATGATRRIGEHARVTAVATGTRVITADAEGTLVWWQTVPARQRAPGPVRGLATSASFVAAATTAGPIALYAADGKALATLAGHAEGSDAVAFSPDGKLLVSGGQDRVVRVWKPAAPATPAVELGPTGGDVRHVVFARGGEVVAAAGDDGKVRTWRVDGDTIDPATMRIVHAHTGAVIALATDGGDRLVSIGRDRTRVELDLARGTTTTARAERAVQPIEGGAWTLRAVPLPIAGGRDLVVARDGRAVVVHDAGPHDLTALRARLR